MSKSRIVAAIDIGSDKITSLIAQANVEPSTLETSVSVVGVSSTESRGVKKGQIVDIEDAVEATIVSVEGAERMAGYNLDKAIISVGGAHISSQNSTGVVAVSDPNGEVSAEDVDRVIEAARAISLPASRDIIHVLPREYIVDGESGVKDPVGMTGVRLEVSTHLITASSAALKNLAKTVNEVGVDIQEVVFSGLASSFATLSETEKELGCVLVDLGSGTTSIAAFVDDSLAYSGSLPIGARNITNDLAIGLRVSLDVADKIKLSLGDNKKSAKEERGTQINLADFGAKEHKKVSKRTLTEGIMRPRMTEIFSMIKLDLERNKLINKVPSGVILTGGGALTYGIEDAAKRTLGLPVRVANPSGVTGLIDDIKGPAFALPVGLILHAAQSGSFEAAKQGGSGSSKIKLPDTGIFGKLISTAKELLP